MKNTVAYFYDAEVGSFYYGENHPMKPFRIKLAHQLIVGYELYRKMNVYQPNKATDQKMTDFHSHNYIQFLKRVTPNLLDQKHFGSYVNANKKFPMLDTQNSGVFGGKLDFNDGKDLDSYYAVLKHDVGQSDCPLFPGLFEFSQISCGGTIDAAIKLNHKSADICVNWAGGLHHAKKQKPSGFCYVNDIVLGILELLKYHQRVVYIDIDVHHGDGVEEAFYLTNRVMTVSFHKYGDFFPGTGDVHDIGEGTGKGYAINVPLLNGLTDDSFSEIFKNVTEAVRIRYRPEVVVLQCGADSLAYDKLGTYNTTLRGHGYCVKTIKEWGVPMLVLGGGGYTIKNVARCWTNETGILLGQELDNDLPLNDYYEHLGKDKKLHFDPKLDVKNENTREYLEFIQAKCLQVLNSLEHAPSVGITDFHPMDFFNTEDVDANMVKRADVYNDLQNDGKGGDIINSHR